MEAKIKNALLNSGLLIETDSKNLKITPLLGGKESSVFKVTGQNGKSVIVKLPKTDWQKREIHVFKDYINKLDINSPKFLGEQNNEVLILEFLDKCSNLDSLSLSELELLLDWIATKHEQSRKLFKEEPRSMSKHIDWMIREPFSQIVGSKNMDADIKKKLTEIQPKLITVLKEVDLPLVLDHSDLEIQNLLFNSKRDTVYVVDWANAIKSPGFFDITQFRKLAREYAPNKADSLMEELLNKLNLNEVKHRSLLEYFSTIKEIGLLSYYLNIKRSSSAFSKQIEYSKNFILKQQYI